MTAQSPRPGVVPQDDDRTHRRPDALRVTRSSARRRSVRLAVGVVGLVVLSATASAHELGHGGDGHGAAAALAVVFGLPTLAGLAGGAAVVRFRGFRRSGAIHRGSGIAVGVLLVGLGAASLLPAATGDRRLSIAGGALGAAVALSVARRRTPGTGCGNHTDLALGAIVAHRLLEGVVLGTLYDAGAAVGLLGAVAIAGHTALETAAVGGLYATASGPTRAVGAIVLVQVGFVAGTAAGLGVAGALPASARALALAVVGGALLAVGAGETGRSIAAGGSTPVG